MKRTKTIRADAAKRSFEEYESSASNLSCSQIWVPPSWVTDTQKPEEEVKPAEVEVKFEDAQKNDGYELPDDSDSDCDSPELAYKIAFLRNCNERIDLLKRSIEDIESSLDSMKTSLADLIDIIHD